MQSSAEFAPQLRWRVILASTFFVLDLVFLLVGGGTSSTTVLIAYVPYIAMVFTVYVLCTRTTSRLPLRHGDSSHERIALMVVAFTADFAFIAVQLHLSGGGWWHGATLFILAIGIAAITVPPRALALVTTLGVAIYVGKGWLEISGAWVPPVWGTFPRVDGNTEFFWNYAAFGTISIVAAAIVQWRLVQRIRNAQQRLRTVVDASPYLVLTVDHHDDITTASRATQRITGHAPEQLTGASFFSLFDASELVAVKEVLRCVRGGERLRREFRGVAASGAERWYGMGFSRINNESQLDDVVVMVRDMTDERAQLDERARLARELEAARRLELVGRLVSGVAHELNNPLSAILALSEQLEQEPDASGVSGEARIIHEQARRARTIVRDLLQVVRAPAHSTRELEDVRDTVTDALDALRTRPEAKRVQFEVRLSDTPLYVSAEEGTLGQVITNLIVNAMQAMSADGSVVIDVSGDAAFVHIAVRDDGHGFDPETSVRLFEPFFTTRAPGQGTGLGLAVSRAIIERHGGSLRAESIEAPERGAQFTVTLPRELSVAPGQNIRRGSAPPWVTSEHSASLRSTAEPAATRDVAVARRVFVIDDERSIRLALRRWFVRNGWHVEECADGAEALERLLGDGPAFDVILCDLKMPGTSGMQVYATLERTAPALLDRLIITTGDVASADVAAFLALVQVPVLEKPFGLQQLTQLLERRAAAAGSP